MRRPLPVLRWALSPCQLNPRSAGIGTGLAASKEWIQSCGLKALPSWAASFSTRRAVLLKPKDDSTLRSVGVALPSDAHNTMPGEDHLQVLFEWKALQSKLHGVSGEQTPAPPDQQSRPPSPASLSASFFDSNTSIGDVVRPAAERRRGTKTTHESLWITQLDYSVLGDGSYEAMVAIRAGERDLGRLAQRFLRKIERMQGSEAATNASRALRAQEIKLFILAQWIARASLALSTDTPRPASVGLLLDTTLELYMSMRENVGEESWSTSPEHSNLRAVQRATMHRLFSLAYPFTRPNRKTPETGFKALALVARILGDTRLRPAQARFLCRRFLHRLRDTTKTNLGRLGREAVWRPAVESIVFLIREDIVRPFDRHDHSTSSDVDDFLQSLCAAMDNRQVDRGWARQAVLEVARAAQDANLRRAWQSRDVKASARKAMAVGESKALLDVLPFASTPALEEMARRLAQCGEHGLALEIAYMGPREQRTLPILVHLMRRWSDVSPDFTPEHIQARQRRSTPQSSFHNCKTSQLLWAEAMSLLDENIDERRKQLLNLFTARMASHARSRAPGLVIADLKALQRVLPLCDGGGLIDTLGHMNDKTQVEAVRAFARAGRLNAALAWGRRIMTAAQTRGAASDDDQRRLGIRMLNVLLSAFLLLKGRGLVSARRRLAIMARRAGALKTLRPHLRTTINRLLRRQKSAMLRRGTRSIKDRSQQFHQATRFLESFASQHGIVPNETTSVILVYAIVRLSPLKVSDAILRRFKDHIAWNWHHTGVAGVLADVRALLAGEKRARRTEGEGIPGIAALIDAGIKRRSGRTYVAKETHRD